MRSLSASRYKLAVEQLDVIDRARNELLLPRACEPYFPERTTWNVMNRTVRVFANIFR